MFRLSIHTLRNKRELESVALLARDDYSQFPKQLLDPAM
jgi:hypothetical protein